MNYHNISNENILNGEGIRVVLWVAGCNHRCNKCHNEMTWNCNSGLPFDNKVKEELYRALDKPYIDGITFSGGDPLHENNRNVILELCREIKTKYPTKTIWLYTGYKIEWVFDNFPDILQTIDTIVDGRFEYELADINYKYAGSTNQRVIDVKRYLLNRNNPTQFIKD